MTPDKLRKMALFLEYFAFMLRRWAKEMDELSQRKKRQNPCPY